MKKNLILLFTVIVLLGLSLYWVHHSQQSKSSDAALVGSNSEQENYIEAATIEDHRAQQKHFDSVNGKIGYLDYGDGDALLLLHGVPTSSWMYRKLIPTLQQEHRVIAVDLLGFGSSDKPDQPRRVYTREGQAKLVADLLKHLNVDTYTIVMHDMGALIAWQLLRMQEPIKHMIVLNSIVHQDGFNNPNFEPNIFTDLITAAYSNKLTSTKMLSNTFEELGLSTERRLTEEECRGYVLPMLEGSKYALFEFFTSLNNALFTELDQNAPIFQRFTGDTLIIWGARDGILTSKQINFLQKHLRIPDDNIHILPDNNHFLAEEIPQQLVDLITSFMADR